MRTLAGKFDTYLSIMFVLMNEFMSSYRLTKQLQGWIEFESA